MLQTYKSSQPLCSHVGHSENVPMCSGTNFQCFETEKLGRGQCEGKRKLLRIEQAGFIFSFGTNAKWINFA